jgi:hypothetical protein
MELVRVSVQLHPGGWTGPDHWLAAGWICDGQDDETSQSIIFFAYRWLRRSFRGQQWDRLQRFGSKFNPRVFSLLLLIFSPQVPQNSRTKESSMLLNSYSAAAAAGFGKPAESGR